jgi:hypothetical protein
LDRQKNRRTLGNNFCQELNSCQYVIKLNSSIVGNNLRHNSDLYRWYISSLGSLNLLDFTTKPIYEYTARLLEAKTRPHLFWMFSKSCSPTPTAPVASTIGAFGPG